MAIFDITSLSAVALGIGSAAALFALHRLRVQPSSKAVATLLFWQLAVQQQRTRVLTGRFTHLPTFLLLLTIALLLAFSLVGDRWQKDVAGEPAVVVIDAGYTMSAPADNSPTRLAEAVRLASEDLTRLDAVTLVSAGAQPRLLATPGDPRTLAGYQLSTLAPGATAADTVAALQLAFALLPKDQGKIIWYTDQSRVPSALPPEITGKINLRYVSGPLADSAIVSVIYEPAPTNPSSGRLRVKVASTDRLTQLISLSATPAQGNARTLNVPAGVEADVIIEDVPADGSAWVLQLAGSQGLTANDTVTAFVPKQSSLSFRFHGEIPIAIRASLLAIGTEADANTPAAIHVLLNDAATPPGARATIRLLTQGDAVPAGLPVDLDARFDDLKFARSVTGSGPTVGSERATTLLRADKRVLASMTPGELQLSSALWTAGGDLPKKPAFPVLMQRMTQALAGWAESPAVSADRAVADPLWKQSDRPTIVYSRPADVEPSAAPIPATPDVSSSMVRRWPLLEMLLVAALTLTVAEGLLFAARKIV